MTEKMTTKLMICLITATMVRLSGIFYMHSYSNCETDLIRPIQFDNPQMMARSRSTILIKMEKMRNLMTADLITTIRPN